MKSPYSSTDRNLPSGLNTSDRKRLVGMGFALIVIVGAIGYTYLKGREKLSVEAPPLDDFSINESVAIPELNVEELETLTRDAKPEQRVLLEGKALDLVLANIRRLTEGHYDALTRGSLEGAVRDEVVADPTEARGDTFTARGWLRGLHERQRTASSPPEFHGRIVDENGDVTYFVVDEKPRTGIVDVDYLRLDGRFLKIFSEEDPEQPGTWIEAPLLVGTTLTLSRPQIPFVAELDKAYLISEIEHDDVVTDEHGVPMIARHAPPYDALWHTMAWGRDGSSKIDWDAAPELSRDVIEDIKYHPNEYVGQVFRFPVCRLQGARVRRAPENPARLDEYTEGWLGNNTWKTLVHFWSPTPNRDLAMRDYVNARGVFVRNFAYSSNNKGVQIAPMFIVTEIASFTPVGDPIFRKMVIGISLASIALTALFVIVLIRDRKRAAATQEATTAKRRARRAAGRIPGIARGGSGS